MTPADVQALIEKWRQEIADFAGPASPDTRYYDDYYNGVADCTNELEPVIQALQALRDEMCHRVRHGYTEEEDDRGGPYHIDEIEDWADRLDVLLHGAGKETS